MTQEVPAAPDQRVIQAALTVLDGPVLTPSQAVGEALSAAGLTVTVAEPAAAPAEGADSVALLHDELSAAGEHAEGLLAAAVAAARPGAPIVVSALGRLHQRVHGRTAQRSFSADELHRALGHHGVDVTLLCAPGAAAIVAGDPHGPHDPELDRSPGLLDAAPRVLAAGRAPMSGADRSRSFFATLPHKVLAAAVVCRDDRDRLLVVHDTYKGHWTIPGGVVDADEDPLTAARREAWEEAGVRVDVGAVLGVFAASWPDRVVLVYDAVPRPGGDHREGPVHAHEIGAVAWWPLDEALERLAPHVAEQVRACLRTPGGTLRQGRA